MDENKNLYKNKMHNVLTEFRKKIHEISMFIMLLMHTDAVSSQTPEPEYKGHLTNLSTDVGKS